MKIEKIKCRHSVARERIFMIEMIDMFSVLLLVVVRREVSVTVALL